MPNFHHQLCTKSLSSSVSILIIRFQFIEILLSVSSMASVSIIKAFVLAVFLAAVVVSAQEPTLAPAPAPDAGAAFSLPVSGALIGTSLLVSLFAALRQ
uniref:Uncharacterized protein n=1 Tax=Solanum lycopersicum TaxID=4081 RepID=A0A3Q7GJT5_SOLLC